MNSTQWVEYHVGAKRKPYNSLPTSNITAEAVTVDGFALSKTDNAGVTTTAGRSYTANGMIQTRTNGRGNTTTTVTDTAGRPLAIQKDATWYSAPTRLASQGSRSQVCSRLGVWLLKSQPAYGWDLTKNICELYGTNGYISTTYSYSPYGLPSQSTNGATAGDVSQPIQWSSEFHDTELGLVYYNYRYYNQNCGCWLCKDLMPIIEKKEDNDYAIIVRNIGAFFLVLLPNTPLLVDCEKTYKFRFECGNFDFSINN